MKRYRLTLLFAITALVVMTVTTIMVNIVGADLAEKNLLRVTEENTARDAAHIQSMISGQHHMAAQSSNANPLSDGMHGMDMPVPLTLEYLAEPQGLPSKFPSLVQGLNIVKFNLFNLDGVAIWSTDPATVGVSRREGPLFQTAVTEGISSKLARDHEIVDLEGERRRIDVVETYLPLRESPESRITGVMEIYRDVRSDFAIQVDDTKATVLRATVGTMAGLFFIFLNFTAVADVAIHRSRRREVSLIENQLAERKESEEVLRESEERFRSLVEQAADAFYIIDLDGRIVDVNRQA